jgi:hypothetical protein
MVLRCPVDTLPSLVHILAMQLSPEDSTHLLATLPNPLATLQPNLEAIHPSLELIRPPSQVVTLPSPGLTHSLVGTHQPKVVPIHRASLVLIRNLKPEAIRQPRVVPILRASLLVVHSLVQLTVLLELTQQLCQCHSAREL